MNNIVIPAQAGIQCVESAPCYDTEAATSMRQTAFPLERASFICRADALRWIPACAGMTVLLCCLIASPLALAEETDNTSHLPLPRFASLRSGEVNMRTGPGTRYPIAWVYTRRGLPVEVIAEYDIWRRVRDPSGTEGWVNKTELTGKREAVIAAGTHDLRKDADDKAVVTAHLEAGAIGQLVSCTPEWCKVKFDDVKGYLRKTDFWGAYPNEKFD